MSENLETAVRAACEKWKAAFNGGDASGCAACYEPEAIMVAKPFGVFKGREAIEGFWTKLIADGFAEVAYIDPQIEVLDGRSAILSSKWEMNNAQGTITKELWVLQDNGDVLLREDHFEAQS